MVPTTYTISVAVGFDADGFESAVRRYLVGLDGVPFTQDQYDRCVEQINSMVGQFVIVGEYKVNLQ